MRIAVLIIIACAAVARLLYLEAVVPQLKESALMGCGTEGIAPLSAEIVYDGMPVTCSLAIAAGEFVSEANGTFEGSWTLMFRSSAWTYPETGLLRRAEDPNIFMLYDMDGSTVRGTMRLAYAVDGGEQAAYLTIHDAGIQLTSS